MNKRKDTVRQGVIKGLELAIILLFLSIILGMVIVILTVIPSDFRLIKALVSDRLLLAVNIWPIFCVMFLLYFLCNSIGGSFVGTGLLFMVVAEVNRFKITFRDDPFVFADVLLAAEAKEMTKKYQLFLDKATFCAIIILVLVAVGSFWILKIKIKHISSRVIGIVSVVAIFGMLYSPIYFNSAIYDGMWHAEFGNIWKESNQYMSRGLVYSFLRSIPNAVNVPPEGYLEKESEEKLDNYQTVELAENKKVNVISIMLEAYNDFSKFEQIEFAENPYKTFHEIQENSYSGKLYTDIFAGGTIQTERSFLTGYSGQIKSKKNTESFVRYFKSQGYYTEAMHPGFGWFYDRKNIDEYLGFDSFVCYENKFQQAAEKLSAEERYGSFLKDIDFFDYIIKGYEEAKKKKQNYFHFSVTYQNHGPYPYGKPETETEYLVKKANYPDEEYEIMNSYLSGIADTDMALEKLYTYINQQKEPVILILFGDHNPWLGENNSVYDMLGINLNLESVDGGENYYETPYLFYANQAAKETLGKDFVGTGNTISPMFLMSELFDYIEMEGPRYLNYLSDVKKEVDVKNPVYVKQNGEYIQTKLLQEKQKLQEVENIEYYMKKQKVK